MSRPRSHPSAIALLFAIACSSGVGEAAAGSPRNLLLITLDTVRADRLQHLGGEVATPHLDRLAREGVTFTRARAPVPLTLPSHASILTGNYPPTHGVRDNATFALPADQLTLAEILAARGHATAAFVGSFVLDRRFGLAQGFELYDDRVARDPAQMESLEAERSAGAVATAFARWLETGPRTPFLAWLHFYDPHAPYAPPEPFLSRYRADPYGGEIAYVDQVVGEVLARLDEQGHRERTIVAVVADHGEGLGEHREPTHSVLIYNSTLHVPLLIRAPGLVPAGTVVDDLVRTIDLAPTLLDYLGVTSPFGEGVSLRSRIEAAHAKTPGPDPEELAAYSESLYASLNLGWSELRGLEAGGFHFILAPETELYDLAADPGETENRIHEHRDVSSSLRRRLAQMTAAFAPAQEPSDPLDPDLEARLRSLGYISSSRANAPARQGLVDPKTRMLDWNRIQQAVVLFGQGAYREAATILEELFRTEREIPLIYEYLGWCYLRLGKGQRAETVFRQALERGLETAGMRLELGRILADRGETDAAERELRAALTLDARSVRAHQHLADLLRGQGRHAAALAHYRRAVDLNPDYAFAWGGMARSLAVAGTQEEALRAFRRAAALAPGDARAQFNLAVQLERMNRPQEAIRAYETFLELAASDAALVREREIAVAAVERLRTS